MKRFDFLLLDADGTLFDFDRAEARALEQVFRWAGIDDVERARMLYLGINRGLWDAFERGEVTKEFVTLERFVRFLRPWTCRGMGWP